MKYISTRGLISPVSFKEAVMMGLATDGGLLLPESLPVADREQIAAWRSMTYPQLAFAVLSLYVTDIPASDLEDIVNSSYATFNHSEITPLVQCGNLHILELFHGPTLAFKDVALQFLGNIFEYLLAESGGKMNILGATSGDTGSAAIYGVRGRERINIFILHPHNRVSRIQELQMTTVTDANVFNLAIQGSFDDGQAIVKAIFNDISFKKEHHLGAINSINWARIVAQIVYYIYAALKLSKNGQMVDFTVPTGNFGDIFAGYVARTLLPNHIRRLILATNENDILTRFVNNGEYSLSSQVTQTSSPSMDIQVASNFERFLYYLNESDPAKTREDMNEFAKTGHLSFTAAQQKIIKRNFSSKTVSQSATAATIKTFFDQYGYILDPHTAVGVNAGQSFVDPSCPMVCLATAHPAKFGEAVAEATGQPVELPPGLQDLEEKESRCEIIAADKGMVKSFVAAHGL
jgi:threonine synthase